MGKQFKWIPDYKVESRVQILAETQDYNHRMMNIPAMWRLSRGAGIKIAVLDTGLPKHMDLKPAGGESFVPNYLEDKNGHATHCGGIINAIANNGMGVAGIAPDAEVYYGAVMDGAGSGEAWSIASGVRWAVDTVGAQIISMSLGVPAGFDSMAELEEACNYARDHGVAVFAAAGNEGGGVGQPACYDSVIAVAAVDSAERHAQFSNMGAQVDFAAGGVDVYSTYLRNSYARLSGTSMACPALAAVGALILAEHKARGEVLTPDDLIAHLKKIAYDVGPAGFDELTGAGIPIFSTGDDLYAGAGTPTSAPAPLTWWQRLLRALCGR